ASKNCINNRKCTSTTTKKAVIVKLLLVYLKATLRKLHNTYKAPPVPFNGLSSRALRARRKLSYYMQPYYSFNIFTYFKFFSLTLSKFSFPIYKIELDQFTKSKFFKSSIRYSPEISKSSKANLKGCISYNFFINCKRYSNNSFGQLLFSSQFCGSI